MNDRHRLSRRSVTSNVKLFADFLENSRSYFQRFHLDFDENRFDCRWRFAIHSLQQQTKLEFIEFLFQLTSSPLRNDFLLICTSMAGKNRRIIMIAGLLIKIQMQNCHIVIIWNLNFIERLHNGCVIDNRLESEIMKNNRELPQAKTIKKNKWTSFETNVCSLVYC